MRTQLQIGEIAQLLGITTKAIRHYHKIGLLQEPERTESGYRLYDANDLLRLQKIRHLQSLGLSLRQVQQVLGTTTQEHTLREVLQSLDQELAQQIDILEQRRQQIQRLLTSGEHETHKAQASSPAIRFVLEHLGEQVSQISPALWEMEMRTNAMLESFQWPAIYHEKMIQLAHYFAEHPHDYQHILQLGERIAALAHVPEDAPEVEQLIQEYSQDSLFSVLQQGLAATFTSGDTLPPPFITALSNLTLNDLSPAQQRFLRAMIRENIGDKYTR